MTRGPVMADLEGAELTAYEKEFLLHPYLGALILFARNFQSASQVRDLVASVRAIRPELIIAVDQEGGRVQRFREGFTRLPPMQVFRSLFSGITADTLKLAEYCGWVMASEVRSCDVDLSFAPVIDVDCDFSSIIGNRAFSDSAEDVVQLAGAFIDGMHKAGMGSVGKHYPGHGAVRDDSHLMTPVDERDFSEIEQRELLPFVELIRQGKLDGIMPAHVVYSKLDDKPAVFSPFWLKEILRQKLGFKGVIFSDDLCMEGAAVIGSFAQRAEEALGAGCDMILVCNNRPATLEILSHLEKIRAPIRDTYGVFRQPGKRLSFETIRKDSRYLACQDAQLFGDVTA